MGKDSGGTVSAARRIGLLTFMVRVSVAVFPAASLAVIVMILSSPQWRGMSGIVQVPVPEAVPFPPRSFAHVTLVTLMLSELTPIFLPPLFTPMAQTLFSIKIC